MFELEKLQINPSYEEFVKRVVEKHEAEITLLLEDTSKRLGEGRTADVCFLESNEKVCLKIYKSPDQIKGADFYLTPAEEKVYLEKLRGLDEHVRVPKVYASYKDKEGRHDFLMMETLPAVSVDDILQDRAELPPNFNIEAFQKDLLDFVEKMHSEIRVCHRDLHEGNIMIDKETCAPYIIDFGAAGGYWDAERNERGPYDITKNAQTIRLTSDEAMVKKVTKMLVSVVDKSKLIS